MSAVLREPELPCPHCGCEELTHVTVDVPQSRGAESPWRNKCAGCGLVSEYLPTREEIAAAEHSPSAARPIRGETSHSAVRQHSRRR